MNSIPETQNSERQLDRLAAQRVLYSTAKRIQFWQIVLSVPCVVALSFLVALFPDLKPVAAAWGALLTILDVSYLSNRITAQREKAARIQELFDCDVLQLEWPDLKAGHPPDPETIEEAAAKYRHKDPDYSKLRDWHTVEVGNLPLELARIICQRANCRWDAELRQRYAGYVLAGAVALGAVVLGVGFIGGMTLDKFFLAVVLPMMPAWMLVARQRKENKESAAAINRLKEHTEKVWKKAIVGNMSADELARESRELQNEIFDRRRRSPLIFDGVYNRLQKAHEQQMSKSTAQMIEDALKVKGILTAKTKELNT